MNYNLELYRQMLISLKRGNRQTTSHRRKGETATKTASVKNHTVISPPKHIGGEQVCPSLPEITGFMG